MKAREFLVCYDVGTLDADGEKRLRQVAKTCEGFGHRVQKSVFECLLTQVQLRELIHALQSIIDPDADQIDIYQLREPLSAFTHRLGRQPAVDPRAPFVL